MTDLYETLGVPRDADGAAIKRAHRKRAKETHPDVGGLRDEFEAVQLAVRVLSDRERRETYDRTGRIEDPGPDVRDQAAMTLAFATICQVCAEIDRRGGRPEDFDLVKDATATLKKSLSELSSRKANVKRDQAAVLKIAKRFRPKKGKANRLAPMFDARARDLEHDLTLLAAEEEKITLSIAILSDHSFDRAPRMAPVGTIPQMAAWT